MDKITVTTNISDEKKLEIGIRLSKLRVEYSEKHKVNQEDFGKLLGLDYKAGTMQKTISHIENGDISNYYLPLLQRYADVCGASLDYIINGTEYKRSDEEFTFVDLCKEIAKLDKCGLIDIVKNGDVCGFKFHNIADPLTASQKSRAFISDRFQNFIAALYAAKKIQRDEDLPRRDWLAENAVDGAVDDFDFFLSMSGTVKSADRLLQQLKQEQEELAATFMNLPDPIDEDEPMPTD